MGTGTDRPDFPVVGSIVVQAYVTLPGRGGQGISIRLYDCGAGKINIDRYQEFVGIRAGDGIPLE